MTRPWWQHPLRIYQPNLRLIDGGQDASNLIRQAKDLSANAVVVNAGGAFAFYPTDWPGLVLSTYSKGCVAYLPWAPDQMYHRVRQPGSCIGAGRRDGFQESKWTHPVGHARVGTLRRASAGRLRCALTRRLAVAETIKITHIETLRAGIPALREMIFLNTAGISPIPSVVADEVVDLIRWQEEKGRYRPDVQEMLNERSEDAREITARFFGVTPEEITFTHSISEGLNIVSEGIDWKAGDEVIITDQEHPSGYMPWALRADQQGVILKQLRLLPEPEGMVDRLRNLLTDRTRVVALSHVTSSLGIRAPVEEIVRAGHEAGALVGFDGAQSAG